MLNDLLEEDAVEDYARSLEKKAAADLRAQNERDAWRQVLATPAGVDVLKSILTQCHIYQLSYTRGDSFETAYREGARRVGLWLLTKVADVEPSVVPQIIYEPKNLERKND